MLLFPCLFCPENNLPSSPLFSASIILLPFFLLPSFSTTLTFSSFFFFPPGFFSSGIWVFMPSEEEKERGKREERERGRWGKRRGRMGNGGEKKRKKGGNGGGKKEERKKGKQITALPCHSPSRSPSSPCRICPLLPLAGRRNLLGPLGCRPLRRMMRNFLRRRRGRGLLSRLSRLWWPACVWKC